MASGNRAAISSRPQRGPHGEPLAGRSLEDALRALAWTNPDIVELRGSAPALQRFLATPPARGRELRYDELEWPEARATAVAWLRLRKRPTSQKNIGEVLDISERTVRENDKRQNIPR